MDKKNNIFWQLALIDFESDRITYDDLRDRYSQVFKESSYKRTTEFIELKGTEWGWLVKLWFRTYKLFPRPQAIDLWLMKHLGGHLNLGKLTWYGHNAMSWTAKFYGKLGIWTFQPPCFNCRRKFTWGEFRYSSYPKYENIPNKVWWKFKESQ